MRTYKRRIADIDTSVNNISKFDNQLTFTGIKLDKNIYNIDQKSQTDALNVYVEDEQLKSRDPLLEAPLGILLNENDVLLDIKEANNVKVYVVQNGTLITVTAKRNDLTTSITCNTNYHIAIYNQYIICFRNEGAMVIDTNSDTLTWQSLNKYANIPITKITTGPSVETFDENEFTKSYREKYIRTNTIRTLLPEGNANVKYITSYNTLNYQLNQADVNTDFRILRSLNVKPTSVTFKMSAANGIVCIGEGTHVLLSFDKGNTFSKIVYPLEVVNYTFKPYIETIGENGKEFFVVNRNGVYIYDIGNLTWTYITPPGNIIEGNTNTSYQKYHFINKSEFVFAFRYTAILENSSKIVDKIYVMHNGRLGSFNSGQSEDVRPPEVYTDEVAQHAIRMLVFNPEVTGENKYLLALSQQDVTGTVHINLIYQSDSTNSSMPPSVVGTVTISDAFEEGSGLLTFNSLTYDSVNSKIILKGEYGILGDGSSGTFTLERTLSQIKNGTPLTTSISSIKTAVNPSRWTYPKYLADGIYLNTNMIYDVIWDSKSNTEVTTKLCRTAQLAVDRINNEYYSYNEITPDNEIVSIIYTNAMTDDDIVEVEYTYIDNTGYDKVPTLSYSGSELYLVFDNVLKITQNIKNGEELSFNLTKLTTQAFANKITNLINISTSELALFFNNDIIICTKSENETFGIVYSYNKTRLSLGVRAGDDVINTLDGAASLLPTIRGLALMNYQAYMATSDQVLSFVSDDISDIWKDFYNNGKNIKMTQMKNFIFITNQTKDYLMLDMKTLSWWKFRIPVAITKFTTDQNTLNVISKQYYVFDANYNRNKYFDFDGSIIDWRIVSQRLHFGLPNHYKNLKQLIFQLMQTNEFKNTILTQIKLYRKVVTYKEPEIVNFKIDEYRTFVKRFNYWKINEVQWGLSNDRDTAIPAQLVLNGIDIKYEIGEEVR